MKAIFAMAVMSLGATGLVRSATAGPLTLAQAREEALKLHPSITVAELRALIAQEATTEARAGFFPVISAIATGVGTGEPVTRLAAGGLSNSQIFDRIGTGLTLNLLVTDFGRTANLTEAARLHARAADADVETARTQLLLAVDTTYLGALEAQAVKAVAEKALANRQILAEQIRTLARSQLKSELEVRFAQVGVDEARLLAAKADDEWQSELAVLTSLLGQRAVIASALQDEPMPGSDLPANAGSLGELALRQRPELRRLRSERDAAQASASAAKDARRPTISVLGSAGVVPVEGAGNHFEHNYAAVGVNVNLPLFAGGLYLARQHEAELQASATGAALQAAEDDLLRDVRLAWLAAAHARENIALTQSLLDNSNAALELARTRFTQGLSSIVELNQAELAQISAELAYTNAKYEYQIRRDVLDYQTGGLQ